MTCLQVGCDGEIDDGYCTQCGLAAPQGRTQQARTAPSARRPAPTAATRRTRLGSGLVDVPLVPAIDPSTVVMRDPTVPEQRRYCARCEQPVGRTRGDRPGRTEGFCRACGARFSFSAKLAPGDIVGGQYEVVGCLAHGGLGWIYLARDRKVSDRWVVLKGLLDSNDEHALAVALAERRFLAEVEHPNIVKIHNFVEHGDDGYIVMEYVNGISLRGLLEARRAANGGRTDPLPIEQAIAYCLEILPAIGHLHDLGLAYCDFKPDNVIQAGGSVKLIDLGGVYRMDDESGPIYGTIGFQAPEIAETGPTVASDLFTVGRTLAVLSIDFPSYQTTHRFDLPAATDVALFARFDSLYAFLLRATARDPMDRFDSAEEMAGQLTGVLREIVAAQTGAPAPGPSARFTAPGRAALRAPDWRALPTPLVNTEDPDAALIVSLGPAGAEEVVRQLGPQMGSGIEVDLWLARALIEQGDHERAGDALALVAAIDEHEWRVRWYRGIIAFAAGRFDSARTDFAGVYRTLPGELAPKLALGMTAEAAGDFIDAARWYDIVSRTDGSFTSAAFGLARCLEALGLRRQAAQAYERVPETSSDHLDGKIAEARLLLCGAGAGDEPMVDIAQAAAIVERLTITEEQRARLSVEVLDAAVRAVDAATTDTAATILGHPITERGLRLGLELALRNMARHATTRAERVAIVERANRQRPKSLR